VVPPLKGWALAQRRTACGDAVVTAIRDAGDGARHALYVDGGITATRLA